MDKNVESNLFIYLPQIIVSVICFQRLICRYIYNIIICALYITSCIRSTCGAQFHPLLPWKITKFSDSTYRRLEKLEIPPGANICS